jgi:hypothetical protein
VKRENFWGDAVVRGSAGLDEVFFAAVLDEDRSEERVLEAFSTGTFGVGGVLGDELETFWEVLEALGKGVFGFGYPFCDDVLAEVS